MSKTHMISRSDWEPLPTPTLSPFARGYLSLCRFFTAAVWCVPALRVPLVHSLIKYKPTFAKTTFAEIKAFAFSPFVCRFRPTGAVGSWGLGDSINSFVTQTADSLPHKTPQTALSLVAMTYRACSG